MTDGRFSGGSHGFIIDHVVPEAQEGGPIALVQSGDAVTIDTENGEINMDVTPEVLEERRKGWTAPPLKARRGTLRTSKREDGVEGCVTDE